jgi:hypothetical protein
MAAEISVAIHARLIAVCFLKLVKRHRDSFPTKLKPRSFPVHDSNGTSGCQTLLATRQLL